LGTATEMTGGTKDGHAGGGTVVTAANAGRAVSGSPAESVVAAEVATGLDIVTAILDSWAVDAGRAAAECGRV